MNESGRSLLVPTFLRASLARINYRLFGVLVLMGLLPTLYTTVRIHFLGALPGDWGYNIASQLAWLGVTYEVVHEALMLPMFFLVGRFLADKEQFEGAVSNGLLLTIVLYLGLSGLTIVFARPMVELMAQKRDLIDATASYIRLEALGLVLAAVVRYLTLVLITLNRDLMLVAVLALQLVLSVVFDSLFLSSLPFSLMLGVNGIAYTNIIVNAVLAGVLFRMLRREGIGFFGRGFSINFSWMRDWLKIGGLSGLESFVRNAAFVLMVIRLVNLVEKQGTFWLTNNFIWGWLLVPVLALGDLIKRDTAENAENVRANTPAYTALTALFVLLWIVTIPVWKNFIHTVMGVAESETVYSLSLLSLSFYVVFAFNNIADSVFYGRGRTDLMLYQSLIVNSVFYGGAFIAWRAGIYTPDLLGIAVMFGAGIALDSLITFIMFGSFWRKAVPA